MDSSQSFFYRHRVWLLCAALLLVLLYLQYRLRQEHQKIAHYNQQIATQMQENQRLLERNRLIAWDIHDLKQGLEATEKRARYDLGMIKEDEILYYIPNE